MTRSARELTRAPRTPCFQLYRNPLLSQSQGSNALPAWSAACSKLPASPRSPAVFRARDQTHDLRSCLCRSMTTPYSADDAKRLSQAECGVVVFRQQLCARWFHTACAETIQFTMRRTCILAAARHQRTSILTDINIEELYVFTHAQGSSESSSCAPYLPWCSLILAAIDIH
jgi:hypothetical protein